MTRISGPPWSQAQVLQNISQLQQQQQQQQQMQDLAQSRPSQQSPPVTADFLEQAVAEAAQQQRFGPREAQSMVGYIAGGSGSAQGPVTPPQIIRNVDGSFAGVIPGSSPDLSMAGMGDGGQAARAVLAARAHLAGQLLSDQSTRDTEQLRARELQANRGMLDRQYGRSQDLLENQFGFTSDMAQREHDRLVQNDEFIRQAHQDTHGLAERTFAATRDLNRDDLELRRQSFDKQMDRLLKMDDNQMKQFALTHNLNLTQLKQQRKLAESDQQLARARLAYDREVGKEQLGLSNQRLEMQQRLNEAQINSSQLRDNLDTQRFFSEEQRYQENAPTRAALNELDVLRGIGTVNALNQELGDPRISRGDLPGVSQDTGQRPVDPLMTPAVAEAQQSRVNQIREAMQPGFWRGVDARPGSPRMAEDVIRRAMDILNSRPNELEPQERSALVQELAKAAKVNKPLQVRLHDMQDSQNPQERPLINLLLNSAR